MRYNREQLVRVAKRENNSKREYLYVDPLQAKHIPSDPQETMDVCQQLAKEIKKVHFKDRLYVIGFAETATGIAAGVCNYLGRVKLFQNTTRENEDENNSLYFTESHSHATDQSLRIDGLEQYKGKIDRIVFIDDEVTTGNTICKLISEIRDKFNDPSVSYTIASVLNSMTDERKNELESDGIDCIYLSAIPFEYNKDIIHNISYDINRDITPAEDNQENITVKTFRSHHGNVRNVTKYSDYVASCRHFAVKLLDEVEKTDCKNILILGTEEFMYPAIYAGAVIEDKTDAFVKVHSTTRSPIIASGAEGYPLTRRYKLRSLYDSNRQTYIYNLDKYDKVYIVTDSDNLTAGISGLCNALKEVGNDDISVIQWKYVA